MRKYDNNSIHYKDWTTSKLKQEAKEYHDIIHGESACYGKSDLMILDGILNELDQRGITPNTEITFD